MKALRIAKRKNVRLERSAAKLRKATHCGHVRHCGQVRHCGHGG